MTAQERSALVPALREKIAKVRSIPLGDSITEVFEDPKRSYAPPAFRPDSRPHPRVLINREMLPGIREAFKNPECAAAVEKYRALLEMDTDGTLPPAYLHSSGRLGEHNHDYEVLAAIEARALEYLLTGEEYYGYSAILGIMNYISTLDIEWIPSDQCREYGMTIYYAAIVYDWCYDLMSDEDRSYLVVGVEHRLCRGKSGKPEKASCGGVKLEVSFPPIWQGSVTGHGTEMQLLRDFFAISVAIYDEHPGWWNYIGARLENEFVPVREVFYASGMYPQGMSCYAPFRFICDLWSAQLARALYGRNLFPDADMQRIVRSFLANETVDDNMFTSGDSTGTKLFSVIGYCAILSAYLFGDRTARAFALHLGHGVTSFGYGYVNITPSHFLIASSGGIRAASDRHADLPVINKNKGYFNQYISRTGWETNDTVVLMKAGGRNTSNHEHCDAGHFQIWHKGYLTSHTGVYRGYGSDNHYFFHLQSIAHNVPLVYNPAHHDKVLTPNAEGNITWNEKFRYWYSGGQRRVGESASLESWHSNAYIAADSPLMQSKTEDGKAVYAYISTDITRAYEPDTVAYLRRSMLTSYKTDGTTPMTLFIFDRIEAVDPAFKKTFLLQIPSSEAPTVCGNTVTTERGDGRLTLTAVTPQLITALGGEGQNYLVNGVQCDAPGAPVPTWGRVELTPIGERKTDHLLNVLTVGDRGVDGPAVIRIDCGDSCEGAYVAGNAAIFRKSREDLGSDIAFTLPAPAYTYFSGLNEGEFAVLSDGETVATLTVGENQNLAAADLPAGALLLKKLY